MKRNTEKKRKPTKDIGFNIFFTISVVLSVCAFGLLRLLEGDPTIKMITHALIIFLLTILNTAVGILHERVKEYKEREEEVIQSSPK